MWNLSGAAGSESSCWLYMFVAWANAGTWDTGTIGLSLEMWQLRFYTDDKASTNFKQLPSELPWIAFVLCLLQYQHDQKTFAKFCQKHSQENAFTILVPPQLDYITGPSNKMCPGPGITLGLIIQNCHKAIATQKRMIYLPNFLSRALLPLPAGCCSHWGLQACRWAPTLGIVIRQSHPSQPASGIMFPRCPGFTDTIQCHSLTPLSLLVSLQTIFTRSASTQFKPNQDHDINLRRNKSRLIVIWDLLGRKATTTQRRETRDNVS